MSKPKSEYISKVHPCRPPFNWFRKRFGVYTEWQCKCGREWIYISRYNDLNKWKAK